MKIVVKRLDKEIHMGDWHGPCYKWEAVGPGSEIQLFSTKKNAELYRKLRKESSSFKEAVKKFAAS